MPPRTENQTENINSLVSEINASVGRINEGGNRNLPQLTPISPEDIAEPETDMDLPESEPQSDVTGELAGMETMPDTQDEFIQGLEQDTEQAQTLQDTSLDDYLNTLLTQPGEVEATTEAYEREEVNELKRDLLDINDQMRREQLSARRRIEEVRKNTRGMSARGIENEVRRIENESYQKQADLAVIQMARQGRYDSAKEIADRAVAIQMEQQGRILAARELIYQNNKDLFTRAEQREFETKQADRQMSIQREEKRLETLQNVKLQSLQMAQANGAPNSVLTAIQSATTPEEVLQLGGQWGAVDMLEREYKRQQIASSRTNQLLALASAGDRSAIEKLGFDPSEEPEKLDSTTKRQYEEQRVATNDLLRMATEYKNLIETEGFTNEIFGDQGTIGRVNSLRKQMTALYKDAKTLGTLDAGLLELMDGILGEKPTSSIFGVGPEGNVFANMRGRRSERIVSAMNELIDQTQIENARVSYSLGKDPWSDPLNLNLDTPEVEINNAITNPLGI